MTITMTAQDPRHPDLRNFSIGCVSGGSDRTCSPDPAVEWNWSNGTAALNLSRPVLGGPNGTTITGYAVDAFFDGLNDRGFFEPARVATHGVVN